MKVQVLVVSSNRPGGRINDMDHRGFFEACPLHLAWYGPGEEGPLSFEQGRPLLEVVAALKPLLVVFNMKKRVEHWVHPAAVRKLSVPTAMIEVDYCYSGGRAGARYNGSDEWYQEAEFDHVFFRHRIDAERSEIESRSWLPFSNDPRLFRPGSARRFSVGFAGSVIPDYFYPARRAALLALDGLIEARPEQVFGADYVDFLRSCQMGLTCSTRFRYDVAKHVHVPAAGALLLTDGSHGTEALLPDPQMYVRYRSDASDIRRLVSDLLQDPDQIAERAARAAKHCWHHHTHRRRWEQVLSTMSVPCEAAGQV